MLSGLNNYFPGFLGDITLLHPGLSLCIACQVAKNMLLSILVRKSKQHIQELKEYIQLYS